jgi:hypothetical protein
MRRATEIALGDRRAQEAIENGKRIAESELDAELE